MKKFLTVLLALSVVFTYTVGTAFATTYSASDAEAAMDTEIQNQISYLNNAKAQVLNDLPVADNDGRIAFNGDKYFKSAIEAGADKVIADLNTAMVQAKNGKLDELTATTEITDLAPYKEAITNVTAGKLDKTGFETAMKAPTAKSAMDDAQEPLYKAYVIEKAAAVKVSDYSTKTVSGQTLNNQERVEKAIAEFNDAMAAAGKAATSAAKTDAYEAAYNNFMTAINAIPSIEDEKVSDIDDDIATVANMAALRTYLTGPFYDKYKVANYPAVGDTSTLSAIFAHDDIAKLFYEKDAKDKVTSVFGVAIADQNKVTRSEAIAINEAFYKLITDSLDIFEVYAGKDTAKVQAIKNAPAKYLVMASEVPAKVADVEKEGAALKAEYVLGVKVYDDAKVDEAVKAAKDLVYADLGAKDAADYIVDAANDIYDNQLGLNNLKNANLELEKLNKAIAAAKAKFTASVKYGANKTPEEDLVYCSDTYAYANEWQEVANEAKEALTLAQSYDEIDSIMAKAKDDLSKLMLAKDKDDVEAAIRTYKGALKEVQEEQMALVDMSKYDDYGQFWKALANGYEIIEDAITVDEVKAAYAEAQKLLKSVKTDAELDEQLKAVQTLIDALPYAASVKLEDKAQIEAARNAFDAYTDVVNAASVAKVAKTRLTNAEAAIEVLERAALVDELDALIKKIDALPNGDLGATEAIALKAEAQDLKDRIDAFNEDATNKITGSKYNSLSDFVALNTGDVYGAEIYNAYVLYSKAIGKDASVDDILNAIDNISSLTDRQQYLLEYHYGVSIDDLAAMVTKEINGTHMKIYSSAAKGYIKISWKATNSEVALDGVEVYRSTKKTTGFKKISTFKVQKSKKYTTGLKKGTKYYYYVKGYKMVNGEKVYTHQSITVARTFK